MKCLFSLKNGFKLAVLIKSPTFNFQHNLLFFLRFQLGNSVFSLFFFCTDKTRSFLGSMNCVVIFFGYHSSENNPRSISIFKNRLFELPVMVLSNVSLEEKKHFHAHQRHLSLRSTVKTLLYMFLTNSLPSSDSIDWGCLPLCWTTRSKIPVTARSSLPSKRTVHGNMLHLLFINKALQNPLFFRPSFLIIFQKKNCN